MPLATLMPFALVALIGIFVLYAARTELAFERSATEQLASTPSSSPTDAHPNLI
jgi:hypothetical protein